MNLINSATSQGKANIFVLNRKLQWLAFICVFAASALVITFWQLITPAFAKEQPVSEQIKSLTLEQQQDVNLLIEEALVNDPELLKRAIIALQTREQRSHEHSGESAMQAALKAQQQALYHLKSDPWKGAQNPEITMVYFTDFNCPYCKKVEPALNQLIEEFPQLKIVIKMVPLQGESAKVAVQLAQTVWLNEPKKYIKLKDTLMSSPRRLDGASIAKVAQITGTTQWLNNPDVRVDGMIDNNMQLMRDLRLGGTPSMIIGDKVIPGLVPYEVLKEQVLAVIAQEKS